MNLISKNEKKLKDLCLLYLFLPKSSFFWNLRVPVVDWSYSIDTNKKKLISKTLTYISFIF